MAKLTRITGKVFGETASTSGNDPEIGQFGSALAGTYNATADVATIQGLSAWSNGFIGAVTPGEQFPPLPEMTGVCKNLSYQECYLLQQGIAEWDSATTYYQNNFCAKGGKIYVSQVDSNLNKDPATDLVNWKEFRSGDARGIGEIVASAIPITDAGLHLLDGSLLSGSGSYTAFVNYIATLYNSGDYSDLFISEANWQTAVTTYGVCGKFVYDSVNNTVRLPKITGIVEGTTDVSALGDLVQAGLPNITGTLKGDEFPPSLEGHGAFYNTGLTGFDTAAGSGYACYGIGFNAAYSNSIYGRSNTVQPQTIKVLYYIVVANSTKTELEVDIDEIATDLNGKADTDLSNVTNKLSDTFLNKIMPDYSAGITFSAQITLPCDALIYAYTYGGGAYNSCTVTVGGQTIENSSAYTSSIAVLASKGTVVVPTTVTSAKYYPLKGAN